MRRPASDPSTGWQGSFRGICNGGGTLRSTLDSTEEFRVVTSNGTAEAGRSSGAQTELITESGTNQYHDSLYEYYQPFPPAWPRVGFACQRFVDSCELVSINVCTLADTAYMSVVVEPE